MNSASEGPPSSALQTADGHHAALVALLSDPRSYPHPAGEVRRVETHASLVFLAGDRAYKLKRPVKLPYLDYSTREKRRAAIERELEINQAAAPEIYLGTLAVVRRPSGELALGGDGEELDRLLVMRRFEEDALLSSLAAAGRIDRPLALALACRIAHFHRLAKPVRSGGWPDRLGGVAAQVEAVLESAEAARAGLSLAGYLARLREETAAQTARAAERDREGFVRRCHGDLHLNNLVLWQGEPRLFDAIEFDDELATIDVLYDLAFLLMDLWFRGLTLPANAVFNRYLEGAPAAHIDGVGLLPLYLSLRAAIRAMTGVHGLRFKQGDAAVRAAAEIARYAALAEAFLAPPRPCLVAVGGLSGTGKTTVARELAPGIGRAPGALHLRTDVERKAMLGVAPETRLPPLAYTPEARGQTYRRVCAKAEVALAAGHSVVLDAVFADAETQCFAAEVAERTGAAFRGLWLEAPADVLARRVTERAGDASDADAAVVTRQLREAHTPDWPRADASGTPDMTLANARDALR